MTRKKYLKILLALNLFNFLWFVYNAIVKMEFYHPQRTPLILLFGALSLLCVYLIEIENE